MAKITLVHNSGRSQPSEVVTYLHCQQCVEEIPEGESAETYARLSIGMTTKGIQVWCVRHQCNVDHIKFATEPAENLGPGLIFRKD